METWFKKNFSYTSSSHSCICLEKDEKKHISVFAFTPSMFASWKEQGMCTLYCQSWLDYHNFNVSIMGSVAFVPSEDGNLDFVVFGLGEIDRALSLATANLKAGSALAKIIGKKNIFYLANEKDFRKDEREMMALGLSLSMYSFDYYKTKKANLCEGSIFFGSDIDKDFISLASCSSFWAADLINTSAKDMTPDHLLLEAEALAQCHGAVYHSVVDLHALQEQYPLVHAVGRAAKTTSCVFDMQWSSSQDKIKPTKITLVGKGVCFDTGGLDIKSPSSMRHMKKDMGGAACVLALAHMLMTSQIPVSLRVIIPMVENNISSDSYYPGDILTARDGKTTVEVHNTDAEGRLILADALSAADEDSPDLLIDMATLTGAARVALGPDLPAFYVKDEKLARSLQARAFKEGDPAWHMPLWQPYFSWITKDSAGDILNAHDGGMAGSIVAALFLDNFVKLSSHWVHIDFYAWGASMFGSGTGGGAEGGKAQMIRALYSWIVKDFLAKRQDEMHTYM